MLTDTDERPEHDHGSERYSRDGYLCPIAVLSSEETSATQQAVDAHLKRFPGTLGKAYIHKPHLFARWADELVHHPKILDAVQTVIGPDILCWTANLLVKPEKNPAYVSWHQDAAYWGLDPLEVVTAWVALSPSTPESGCVRVLPGSHRAEVAPHEDTFDKDNMLTRGQAIAVDIDESQVVDLVLAPGEISLHHIGLAHASNPNHSDAPRIGLAIRYISARVEKQGRRESAMIVRGKDGGHFELERRPDRNAPLAGRLAHNRAVRAQIANNYSSESHNSLGQRLRLAISHRVSVTALDLVYAKLKRSGQLQQ